MASITITVPDEYIPGAVARMNELNRTRDVPYADLQEFMSDQAAALASGACFDLKVGPYWVGPVNPAFNQDGTPYTPPAPADPAPEGGV